MTEREILREIDRQEKRFAAAHSGRGTMLLKSARDYHALLKEATARFAAIKAKYDAAKAQLAQYESAVKAAETLARKKLDEAQKMRTKMIELRKVVRGGDSLKRKENVARLRLADKIRCLKVMTVD